MDTLNLNLVRPFAIFIGYMVMVITASGHIIRTLRRKYLSSSSSRDVNFGEYLTRIKIFSVLAAISLCVTWYFMFKFFVYSYETWLSARTNNVLVKKIVGLTLPNSSWERVGAWLKDTSLFEEAWAGAASTNARYWWTQQIFFFATGWVVFLNAQSSRRKIPDIWVYALIGQFVAISFAMNLFFIAVILFEALESSDSSKTTTQSQQSQSLLSTLVTILATGTSLFLVIVLPEYWGSTLFLPILATIHLIVFIPSLPFFTTNRSPSSKASDAQLSDVPDFLDNYLLVFVTSVILLFRSSIFVSESKSTALEIFLGALRSHPAVSSVGSDAILCWISATVWLLTRNRG